MYSRKSIYDVMLLTNTSYISTKYPLQKFLHKIMTTIAELAPDYKVYVPRNILF